MGSEKVLRELQTKTKAEIRQLYDQVIAEIDRNGYMDHAVRAIETIINKKLKDENPKQPVRFFIIKEPLESLKEGQGSIYFFNYGWEMRYSDKGDRIDVLIAISHELGHGQLGHEAYKHNTKFIDDDILETQATYFAKLAIRHRVKQYKDEKYLSTHRIKEDEIDKAAKRNFKHSNPKKRYDENLIPDK